MSALGMKGAVKLKQKKGVGMKKLNRNKKRGGALFKCSKKETSLKKTIIRCFKISASALIVTLIWRTRS